MSTAHVRRGLVIGLDSGTQSSKACIFDYTGNLVGIGRAKNEVLLCKGFAEQQSSNWWNGTSQALRQASSTVDTTDVEAIGIAFQRETFVLLDTAKQPLRPAILWLDTRAGKQVKQLEASIGPERYHSITGKTLDITSVVARLMWLHEHEPSVMAEVDQLWDVGASLAHSLTGEATTCVAGVDTTGLVDIQTRDWSDELLHLCGLSRQQLPRLAEPGERVGGLSAAAAAETGLVEGTPIVMAGGDGQVFNVGVGASAPGSVSLTLGTR
jgi:xylulokinase